MDAPGLVQRGKHIAGNDLIAHKAEIAKQLVIVSLAVGQTTLFVVPMAEEGLLALGADKMLDVPVLAQRSDYSLLNRATTRATNWDAHAVVALEAVQLVHVVGRKSGATLHLAGRIVQLNAAAGAVEVVAVVHFAAEPERSIVNDAMALVAHVLANADRLHVGVALVAQCPILVTNKARVGQLLVAPLAAEAVRMPARRHRLDDATDDKVAALAAAGRKQDVKVTFAVLATLKLVENAVVELAEALGAPKSESEFPLLLKIEGRSRGLH